MSLFSPIPAFCLCWFPGPGWPQAKGDGDRRPVLDVLWVTQSPSGLSCHSRGCHSGPEEVTSALGGSFCSGLIL